MKIQPIFKNNYKPSFKWSITNQVTCYGKTMMKSTEYHRDNGVKLLVIDTWKNGKLQTRVKELYDKSWHLTAQKVIEFKNGVKKIFRTV